MITPEQHEAASCWHSFVRGWQHAAACKPRSNDFIQSENAAVRDAYQNGYEAGICDRRKTQQFATLTYGYSPTILRPCTLSGTGGKEGV